MLALIVTVPNALAMAISAREKRVEFRKKLPLRHVERLLVCEAASGGRIAVEATVTSMTMLAPQLAWERFSHCSGVSEKDFFDYVGKLKAIGCIEISEAKPMKGRYLKEFGISRAPQNFQYIDL